jgi:hypothetical protein
MMLNFYVILSRIVRGVLSLGVCCCTICFWSYSHIILLVFSFCVLFPRLPEYDTVIVFFLWNVLYTSYCVDILF